MNFAKKLKKCIYDIGYTQKTFAEAIQVSPATVSNWCRGDRLPSLILMPDICEALHVSADWLLGIDL